MNADPVARIYRTLEYLAFGRAIERCRFSLLNELSDRRHILILGEGDGRFLARLLGSNTQAHVDVVDSSANMLELARARVLKSDERRVCFTCADALTHLPTRTYDAIVTNFFLDCLTGDEANRVIASATAKLVPNGRWLVSDFHVPIKGLARWHAQWWLRAMYFFFAITTDLSARSIPPYGEFFARAGLKVQSRRFWRWGLLTAEVWRL